MKKGKRHVFQTLNGVVICRTSFRTYDTIKRAVWKAIELGFDTLETVDTERGERLDLTDILQSRKLTV